MLSPIWSETDGEDGRQDVYLVHEVFNRDGQAVITIVASIKPWCGEWRAYWRASPVLFTTAELRVERCKTSGCKLDEDVARAMFPQVEGRYDVSWRA